MEKCIQFSSLYAYTCFISYPYHKISKFIVFWILPLFAICNYYLFQKKIIIIRVYLYILTVYISIRATFLHCSINLNISELFFVKGMRKGFSFLLYLNKKKVKTLRYFKSFKVRFCLDVCCKLLARFILPR